MRRLVLLPLWERSYVFEIFSPQVSLLQGVVPA